MRASFSSFGQYSIAQAEIPETEIIGVGGYVAPQLSVPIHLSVSHGAMKSREGIEIVSLNGKLSTANGQLSSSASVDIRFIIPQGYTGFVDRLHYLEFPLDYVRLSALERLRAGGEAKLRLDAVLNVNKLVALNERPANQPMAEIIWGYVQPHHLHLQAELVIPRDGWISRVLPQVGYGVVHVIEFPATPLEACAFMDHAFKALRQAQEMHRIGLYDEAVAKCRIALEKFFDYEDKSGPDGKTRSVPVLARSWETKLGESTYAWLSGSLSAVKEAANRTHHSPNAHYSQLDSQMLLAITAAIVFYAARTVGLEG